jgi:hypothetical protein
MKNSSERESFFQPLEEEAHFFSSSRRPDDLI